MIDFENVKFKSTNWWRLTFICLGLAVFFGVCADASHMAFYSVLFQIFGVVGMVLLVCMAVIRFDDWKHFFDEE